MRLRVLGIGLLLVCLCAAAPAAWAGSDDIPKKAVCRTCEMRGACHGAEDVVAWREYEGTHYYFCSKDCAKAFDGFPEAYVPQVLPRPAPAATVTQLSGEAMKLEKLRGQVVLLDFWATWCAPCLKAMPALNELHTRWHEQGFTVFGVSIDEKTEDVPKTVEKKKLRYPVALDTHATPAWHTFRVAAIPAMFLIDRDGQIVAEWRGDIDIDAVERTVQQHMSKKSSAD